MDNSAGIGHYALVRVTASAERRLRVAAVLLTVVIVANPFEVRWVYQDWNSLMVAVSIGPAIPFAAFAILTLSQLRRGMEVTSFAPRTLGTAVFLMAVWVCGDPLLGYMDLLLGAIVWPIATALLALAWVRPPSDRRASTIVLACSALPFGIWFAGRADEFLNEALVSGGAVVAIVGALAILRRHFARRPAALTSASL